ncbi:MAG: MmgE/PrpD family protein [Octadecabacter sp.]|nr:MmgE/PrpD family protein [Octadecabacter sp.]
MYITPPLIDFALAPLTATPRARAIAELSAVDWAACGIAGFEEGTFGRWARGQAAAGVSPTFAGETLTGPAAALVNATLSHALDFDDTHFAHIGHPSVAIIAAVLAAKPKDWTAFTEAVLVGFESSIRIGVWLGRDHYQRGFHQTATAGAFGACLGAARAMNLTPDQTQHALGLCASMASGLKAQFGTMGKPLNAGLAARAGLEAAQWAWGGMTGAPDGLDAFGTAIGAERDKAALDGLGATWQVEALSYKFHACCHGLHATLEALSQDTGNAAFDRITIETHPRWMTVCNQPDPQTGLEAKFSYRHVAAMAMLGVSTGDIGSFTDDAAQDAGLVGARSKVDVFVMDDLSETQARVTVERGAKHQVFTHDLAHPQPIEDLDQKLRVKTASLIGQGRSSDLWASRDTHDLDAFITAAFQTTTPQKRASIEG